MENYQQLIDVLNKKGFHAKLFSDSASAKHYLLGLIADAKSIGVGGSVTLDETGIFDAVAQSGKTVYSAKLESQKEQPDMPGMWKNAAFADWYLTGTNALTDEGDLINIDGNGNRVAPMFFGPGHVAVVCGVNKIVPGPHPAVARIKKEACPKNARRLNKTTPCATDGVCGECAPSEGRMCNITVRIQYPPKNSDIHILLIDESLGY